MCVAIGGNRPKDRIRLLDNRTVEFARTIRRRQVEAESSSTQIDRRNVNRFGLFKADVIRTLKFEGRPGAVVADDDFYPAQRRRPECLDAQMP